MINICIDLVSPFFNSLVANAYRVGNDKIGKQFDKPEDIQRSTAIVTVCFGSTRVLRLEHISMARASPSTFHTSTVRL